ncbi:hypothetical protein [Parasphaerochaeta coccoides]|uniref:N-acylglucosamine-6-phosphate 2-epimerase n=1 Tax=Parasphaerochaeta coccoides (strain ATCC BAA-1237 / DSM 17374 / SPN1) TaxID=760011 RepID=F4GLT7_PARC1|nr:hypothetical protein [Parasphaerochaeta coccoides]AEC02978.1 hypothetical protein Spico_1780 [Parasphaerochaeta coccoides DSM 17374]
MKLHRILSERKFSLVVSLPENDLGLARAALDGGCDAVKVHVNVWHRASGHTFGTYQENKGFLRDMVRLCGDVPVGLVPGGADAFISPEERVEMEALGVDFFSSYAQHLPVHMMESRILTKMPAIDSTYTQNTLDAIRASEIDVLECSIQPGELYGTPLNYADILKYADISAKVGKPTLIPTQKVIKPSEVRHLHHAGCKAIMIGAIVLGKDPSPERLRAVTQEFREAIDAL